MDVDKNTPKLKWPFAVWMYALAQPVTPPVCSWLHVAESRLYSVPICQANILPREFETTVAPQYNHPCWAMDSG